MNVQEPNGRPKRQLHEEQSLEKRGRRSRGNKDSMKPVNFKCSWELDARLGRYVTDRRLKERRHIDRSEVIRQVLDEFLSKNDY